MVFVGLDLLRRAGQCILVQLRLFVAAGGIGSRLGVHDQLVELEDRLLELAGRGIEAVRAEIHRQEVNLGNGDVVGEVVVDLLDRRAALIAKVRAMRIEEASAKVRAKGVADDEEDYGHPVWAGVIPVRTVIGAAEPCPRLLPGIERPGNLAGYAEGEGLDAALMQAQAVYEGEVS